MVKHFATPSSGNQYTKNCLRRHDIISIICSTSDNSIRDIGQYPKNCSSNHTADNVATENARKKKGDTWYQCYYQLPNQDQNERISK